MERIPFQPIFVFKLQTVLSIVTSFPYAKEHLGYKSIQRNLSAQLQFTTRNKTLKDRRIYERQRHKTTSEVINGHLQFTFDIKKTTQMGW